MHFLYILHSKKLNRYYVGETADVEFRMNLHLNKAFSKSFTSKANDWVVVLTFQTNTKVEATFLEKFIKKMKSKVFIEKIVANPSILDELLKKNK